MLCVKGIYTKIYVYLKCGGVKSDLTFPVDGQEIIFWAQFFCLLEVASESHGSYNVLLNLFLKRMHIFYVDEEAKKEQSGV